jgi:hypothetical protein
MTKAIRRSGARPIEPRHSPGKSRSISDLYKDFEKAYAAMQAAPAASGDELSSTRSLPPVKAPSLMPSDQPPPVLGSQVAGSGELDHLGPLLGFFGDQLAEVGVEADHSALMFASRMMRP